MDFLINNCCKLRLFQKDDSKADAVIISHIKNIDQVPCGLTIGTSISEQMDDSSSCTSDTKSGPRYIRVARNNSTVKYSPRRIIVGPTNQPTHIIRSSSFNNRSMMNTNLNRSESSLSHFSSIFKTDENTLGKIILDEVRAKGENVQCTLESILSEMYDVTYSDKKILEQCLKQDEATREFQLKELAEKKKNMEMNVVVNQPLSCYEKSERSDDLILTVKNTCLKQNSINSLESSVLCKKVLKNQISHSDSDALTKVTMNSEGSCYNTCNNSIMTESNHASTIAMRVIKKMISQNLSVDLHDSGWSSCNENLSEQNSIKFQNDPMSKNTSLKNGNFMNTCFDAVSENSVYIGGNGMTK